MSHAKCQRFEARINEVMDFRLDPNEDPLLKAHALICTDCHELLDSFAELHAGLSGPNKIPIALLASESSKFTKPYRSQPVSRFGITVRRISYASALAAGLLIGLTVIFSGNNFDSPRLVVSMKNPDSRALRASGGLGLARAGSHDDRAQSGEPQNSPDKVQNVSFRELSDGLRSLSVYHYSGDLPGFRPFHSSLDLCIDWFQNSLLNFSSDRRPPPADAPANNEDSGFGLRCGSLRTRLT